MHPVLLVSSRPAANERRELSRPIQKRCYAPCLACIFAPLLRSLIRSRMSNPLPHHRLAKTQISGAILPLVFLRVLPRPAANERRELSRPRVGCYAPCLACIFAPLLRSLIQLRMPDPLLHHRLAKTQISGAILPLVFLRVLPRPAANERRELSRPIQKRCYAPRVVLLGSFLVQS